MQIRPNDEMEFLVKQTLELKEKFRGRNPFQQELPFNKNQNDQEEDATLSGENLTNDFDHHFFKNDEFIEESSSVPEMPGLLYRIDFGVSTFCIRGYACENMSKSCQELANGNEEIIKALKLPDNADENSYTVQYYPTEYKELAEVVCEQLINQRFPIYEDRLCNLSDPGFSWWMEEGPRFFRIYFKSRGLSINDRLIRLGPLGDCRLAAKRIAKAASSLGDLFPLNEFACTESVLEVGCSVANHAHFEVFKNIFLHGEAPAQMYQLLEGQMERTLYYYLAEVAVLRRFWKEVESQISFHLQSLKRLE
jgi:hypothetical protein